MARVVLFLQTLLMNATRAAFCFGEERKTTKPLA